MTKKTLSSYVLEFNQKVPNLNDNIKELARIYAEAHAQFDTAESTFMDKCRVSQTFLRYLLKVAEGTLYAPMLWQSRGWTRLFNMTYNDQQTIIEDGVPLITKEQVIVTARLQDIPNSLLAQVVTPHGRIRNVDEQARYQEAMKKAGSRTDVPKYVLKKGRVIVTRACSFDKEELQEIISKLAGK